MAWEGAVQGKALFNIKGDRVWEGATQGKALANFRGNMLWKGAVQGSAILNTDTPPSPIERAVLVYLFAR
ncbi:MAG: hypothetical protein EBQ99_02095 [Planctomycetes bacterium]|nr:hypothetical protein [Planctomycetota bacterium]